MAIDWDKLKGKNLVPKDMRPIMYGSKEIKGNCIIVDDERSFWEAVAKHYEEKAKEYLNG